MLTNDPDLTEEDIHITLAALRFMQANLPQIPDEIREIATNDREYPFPDEATLDALCELINGDLPRILGSE